MLREIKERLETVIKILNPDEEFLEFIDSLTLSGLLTDKTIDLIQKELKKDIEGDYKNITFISNMRAILKKEVVNDELVYDIIHDLYSTYRSILKELEEGWLIVQHEEGKNKFLDASLEIIYIIKLIRR